MQEKIQFIIECCLYSLNLIDFITDIIAIGSLGSKKLVAHLLLVLFTIIIERIVQVVFYLKVIKKKMLERNLFSNIDEKMQIIYRVCFLDIVLFFKSAYKEQNDPTNKEIIGLRTDITYYTQNIHTLFSSCACLFFQSHGMIYWGSSDAIIIISNIFHIISLGFFNSKTYLKNEDTLDFIILFTKNIFNLISFFGFWSLASELARPKFLVAHMFASIILLILIYFLFSNIQVQPKDIETQQNQTNLLSNSQTENQNTEQNQQLPIIQQEDQIKIQEEKLKNHEQKKSMQMDNINKSNQYESQNQGHKKQQSRIEHDNPDIYSLNTPQNQQQNQSRDSENLMSISPSNNHSFQNKLKSQFNEQNIQQEQNTPLNSGREENATPETNYNQNNNQLVYPNNDSKKEPNDEVVEKDDLIQIEESENQQNSKEIKYQYAPQQNVQTPQINPEQSIDNLNQVAQNTITNNFETNLTSPHQNRNILKSPELKNTEEVELENKQNSDNFLKKEQVEIYINDQQEKEIKKNNGQIEQYQLNEDNEDIEENKGNKPQSKDLTLNQKIQYHATNILKLIACGFFFSMNYNEKAIFSNLEYLNKPLCSFKAANIVFLFAFVASFNKSDFLPGLRVISILCGVIYLMFEIIYLTDFKYQKTCLYKLFTKKGKSHDQNNNKQTTEQKYQDNDNKQTTEQKKKDNNKKQTKEQKYQDDNQDGKEE